MTQNTLIAAFLILIGLAIACSCLVIACAAYILIRDRNDSRLGRETDQEILAREHLGYGPPHWPMTPNTPRNGSTRDPVE